MDKENSMKTIQEVRDYLNNEQAIARDPATPEWQVFTSLHTLARSCDSVEQFVSQAQDLHLPLEGPREEVKEAQEWLTIALDRIRE